MSLFFFFFLTLNHYLSSPFSHFLQGLALVDRQSRPEIIFLLKVEDLPEGDQERFSSLFSLREKWTEEDIAPYIQDLCGEKQTVGALLTKYARSSMQNGVKVYNSRRPIS